MWIETALLAVLSVSIVELLIRLPLRSTVGELGSTTARAARLVASKRVSDHWKEKAMGSYALTTFKASIKIATLLGTAVLIGTFLVLLFDWMVEGFSAFVISFVGLAVSLIVASAYFVLRGRIAQRSTAFQSPDNGYGLADRLLYRLALGSKPVAEVSFDLDQALKPDTRLDPLTAEHVFISGLARAGTTVLMRRFHDSGEFRSLTYRDMPFVLAPRLWGRLAARFRRDIHPTERAHGDRLLVDADSPESLDEVFWRVFEGGQYMRAHHLEPHRPDKQTGRRYAAYVNAILSADDSPRSRYLSKNNNNILRLGCLREQFPRATLIIPFRNPLTHAESLRRQHLNFCRQQDSDGFVRDYMRWLGHHEFGLDHKPFKFPITTRNTSSDTNPDRIDYWLSLWLHTYTWLEQTAPVDAIFVSYEALCQDPQTWRNLARKAGLYEQEPGNQVFELSQTAVSGPADPEPLALAQQLYQRLSERSASALSCQACGRPTQP